MILTVTLNAALDRTLSAPNFQLGMRHSASSSISLPGGKGVNVARALMRLGEPVIATGLAGGRTGTTIVEQLTAEGILNDFVRIHGESRTSTAIVDPMTSVQSEINEAGPMVGEEELGILLDKLRYLSRGADTVVIAGSLPPGVPEDFYATAIRELRGLRSFAALDTSGPPLRSALAAEPSLVSPNDREAEEIVGYEFQDESDLAAGAEALVQMGAAAAMIHLDDGCVARAAGPKRSGVLRARIPLLLEVASTVGSGDAFLAGYLAAWRAERPLEEALRLAVACGAANTQRVGAGVFDMADVEAYARQVEVVPLSC